MRKSTAIIASSILALSISLTGCSSEELSNLFNTDSGNKVESVAPNAISSKLVKLTDEQNPGPTKDYYWDNGVAKIDSSRMPSKGDVKFASDFKGRSSIAEASLTYSMFENSKGSRQGSPLDPPSWPSENPKIAIDYSLTGRIYHGYAYNRSHSVGDSLAGEKSYTSKFNFTSGLRSQNVGATQNGGMRASEEYTENYWKTHENSTATIWYKVTPVYNKNETMPRGSVVDVLSSDKKLNKEFVILNDAEGWEVNYNNGDLQKVK